MTVKTPDPLEAVAREVIYLYQCRHHLPEQARREANDSKVTIIPPAPGADGGVLQVRVDQGRNDRYQYTLVVFYHRSGNDYHVQQVVMNDDGDWMVFTFPTFRGTWPVGPGNFYPDPEGL